MYICYLDESGTIEPDSSTSHFVLVGLAIPADTWKSKDKEVATIKKDYDMSKAEVHTAWLMRQYREQERVPDFEKLDYESRRRAVLGVRSLNLARPRSNEKQKELIKNYRKTEPYIHLTLQERKDLINKLADIISNWGDWRLFGDAHDKNVSFGEQAFDYAFEQIVTRFDRFLALESGRNGLMVQDNNATACKRLTAHMRRYHQVGTFWSSVDRIIETPLFVDSQLTSMVQLADLCAYVTRRFFDCNESDLFDKIYSRFNRDRGMLVGLRHYTGASKCMCKVCLDHKRSY